MEPTKANGHASTDVTHHIAEQNHADHLKNVVSGETTPSLLKMQVGAHIFGKERATASGTLEPRIDDIEALKPHGRAMARETYCEKFDSQKNVHDAMHETEYNKLLSDRKLAEDAVPHAVANLRDAKHTLAQTPQAGTKPSANNFVVIAAIFLITLTVAPTLHDYLFHTIVDDVLAWVFSIISAGFVGSFLTWVIIACRNSFATWVGVVAGAMMGIGLCAIRMSSADGSAENLLALGLTIVEIGTVVLLEWYAHGLRAADSLWATRTIAEQSAISDRDNAQRELDDRQSRVKELLQAINDKIVYVENRNNRNIHINDLEELAIRAILDGYNQGIAENIGRVYGVRRVQ